MPFTYICGAPYAPYKPPSVSKINSLPLENHLLKGFHECTVSLQKNTRRHNDAQAHEPKVPKRGEQIVFYTLQKTFSSSLLSALLVVLAPQPITSSTVHDTHVP